MLGDVGQQHLVGTRCREVALDVVVVDGGSGALGLSRSLGERKEDLQFRAETRLATLAHRESGRLYLTGDEPATNYRVVVVRVDRGGGSRGRSRSHDA